MTILSRFVVVKSSSLRPLFLFRFHLPSCSGLFHFFIAVCFLIFSFLLKEEKQSNPISIELSNIHLWRKRKGGKGASACARVGEIMGVHACAVEIV